MVFFVILEPILGLLVLALLISQCLIPELQGEPWWPVFRRIWKVRRDISTAEEDKDTDRLEATLLKMTLAHKIQIAKFKEADGEINDVLNAKRTDATERP